MLVYFRLFYMFLKGFPQTFKYSVLSSLPVFLFHIFCLTICSFSFFHYWKGTEGRQSEKSCILHWAIRTFFGLEILKFFMKHNLTPLPAPFCDLLFHRTETLYNIAPFSSDSTASWEHLPQPFFTFAIMSPQWAGFIPSYGIEYLA